jgi:hypothetical protein
MPLVENDDVIEQVPAATTHETFCHAVLPRAAEAGLLRFDDEALDGADDLFAEVRSAVEDQILRRFVVREPPPKIAFIATPSGCSSIRRISPEAIHRHRRAAELIRQFLAQPSWSVTML